MPGMVRTWTWGEAGSAAKVVVNNFRSGTEQIVGAVCDRFERATLVALDPIVLLPAPI
jgi:hypothetical protein